MIDLTYLWVSRRNLKVKMEKKVTEVYSLPTCPSCPSLKCHLSKCHHIYSVIQTGKWAVTFAFILSLTQTFNLPSRPSPMYVSNSSLPHICFIPLVQITITSHLDTKIGSQLVSLSIFLFPPAHSPILHTKVCFFLASTPPSTSYFPVLVLRKSQTP